MTTFTFRRVYSTILLGALLLYSVVADAWMVDVTITADVTPEFGQIFGQTESSTALVSFRLDTSDPVFIPAGTLIGPFPRDIIATDLYGYHSSALYAISASYGTKTWDADDVISGPLGGYPSNPSAAIWFDGPVIIGGNAIATIVFDDEHGLLVTAGLACGIAELNGGCKLLDRLEIFDYMTGNFGTGGPLSVSVISVPEEVSIDIKPGSYPNSINLESAGVIPVAILSSPTFDATTIDPNSVILAGAGVRMVGKADRYLCQSEDVNSDGLVDLMCLIETDQLLLEPGDSQATLEATTIDGYEIFGTDTISIVPDN